MAVQYEKGLTTRTHSGPCSCGCAPCDEISCGLDCVVQPRYFCGQLLTDADLTAAVTWSQGKFRLARRREGWGVVCGLDVTCGPQPGTVTVRPGYAVDCCGDDIVVCSDTTLDINKLFQQPPKGCEPGQKQPSIELGKKIENGEEVAVDIYIHYREEQIIPTTTLARAACGQSGECEYSRIKETYQLTGKMIRHEDDQKDWGQDPLRVAAINWVNAFKADIEPFRNGFLQYVFEPNPSAEKIQSVLRRWYEEHPLYQFCWLNGFTTSANPQSWLDERQQQENKYPVIPEMLFLIVQDRINRHLARTCPTCEDQGVPLARIWLRAKVSLGKTQYEVEQISSLPPYRREQLADRLPAPLGWVNRGEVIWRSPEDARSILADYNIRLLQQVFPLEIGDEVNGAFNTFEEFWQQPFLEIGETFTPIVYRDRYAGYRLVGVRKQG